MKHYFTKILLGLSFTSFLVACTSNTEIEISADEKGGVLILDETDTLVIDADSIIFYDISVGAHKMVYNGGEPEEFRVNRSGGILNLGRQRLVRMTGEYGAETLSDIYNNSNVSSTLSMYSIPKHNMITIDSVVYIMHENVNDFSDRQINTLLKRHKEFAGRMPSSNMMKLYESELFIHKDWDYGLNEEFPEEILMSENSQTTVRTKMVEETLFRLYALLSPETIKMVPLGGLAETTTEQTDSVTIQ